MSVSLKQITYSMFRNNFEREKNGKFIPCFYRFIGVNNPKNYNDVLKTLEYNCAKFKNISLIFDGSIKLTGEMELIQYIYNELSAMNIWDMANQDIKIFNSNETNNLFLKALDYVIPLAVSNENFLNENVRNNFITKLIVWAYTYLKSINFNEEINPKCIYYGKIERHEIYFLILLHLMNFDVIYINPLKDELWEEIDKDNLNNCEKSMNILPVESFYERVKKGNIIENKETITKQIQKEVEEQLFSNTGIFKPWQFRDGYTKSVLLDTILEDIYIYWNEPAKLRPNFMVEGNIVKVPCFFSKIDGEYSNIFEYQKLVKYCIMSENTLFFNDGKLSKDIDSLENIYEFMFCQLSDGTFDIDEIKKSSNYKLKKYSEEVQNLLLNKFNEIILDKDLYVEYMDREKSLVLLGLILNLNQNIVKLIDNFDFTSNIPKIVIYLDKEDEIPDSMVILLGYLHNLGIDIIIFNPSGLFNINKIIRMNNMNNIRLEKMNYGSKYKNLKNYKTSMFSRFLNK
ncbi:YceG family protein [Clostridium tarantellae]|uniref:Putative component of 'biosynthetic module' domain-containing protein n=1 Tax=Clostridium tarantellae TaxID=39493 RepID=A0A6I1MH52_9CLOT|nr:YceG family protein [Clostridium tarantellae]MPQ42866.1 hypothetical protein [Clostridium tarantellae]